jgi:acetyl esterase/lipase
MASPQAEAYHALVRQFREAALGAAGSEPPTIEQMRAGAEQSMQALGVMPPGVTTTETALAGREALQFDPDGGATDRVVLYFHGGAYIMNSVRTHAKLAAGIAKAVGSRVVSFDYRMAPEHPFPAAVEDGLAAYRALIDSGIAPSHIAIAGDSAGGGLTYATVVAAKAAGLPQPAATFTFSPWTDLAGTGDSMIAKAGVDLMVDHDVMTAVAAIYLCDASPDDPRASVHLADLTGTAPTYIQVGGDEVLLDNSTRLAVRAAHAGCEVRLDVFPEMQHVFQAGLGMLPESDDALARIGEWLRPRLGLA